MFHTSAAAVLKNGQFNRKRNFVGSYLLFLIVGAVFACIPLLFSGATARDYPGNRGRRPLPPTINYNVNGIEFYVVSHERRLGRERPV
jgi:hypothetical protein